MKQIKTKSGDIICVEVPECATWWVIIENNLGDFISESLNLHQQFLQYGTETATFYNPKNFYLPSGRWEIIGKLSELTDDDCEEFVCLNEALLNAQSQFSRKDLDIFDDKYIKNWKYQNYLFKNNYEFGLEYPKDSFISLLQSECIDTSKELLIIKLL